jgi:hypothetical protein
MNKRKKLEKYQLLNIMAMIVLFITLSSLSMAYSTLSQKLNVTGTVTIRPEETIRIDSIGGFTSTDGGYDIYNPDYNESSFSTKISLPNLTSKVTYTVTIKNYSNKIQDVKTITSVSNTNSSITYKLNGIRVGKTISPNETVSFTVTYYYLNTITTVPEDTINGSNIQFTFKEHEISDSDYITDGMLLNLRGVDAPINNTWVDNYQGKSLQLNDVTYDSENRKYLFANSSYGTLNEAIIPETGDFTLEVRFSYPSDIASNIDQAIVAQVNDKSNDTGRFKLNAYYGNSANQILIFYNDNMASTNKFSYFTKEAELNKIYEAQIVRNGSYYELYLNGVNTQGGEYVDEYTSISQGSFKLGRWNDAANQSFHGGIYTVRLYDRALSETELKANRLKDEGYYPESKPVYKDKSTIFKYATNYQDVSDNGSLYTDDLNNYVYRGDDPDNYVKINGSDDIYRIVNFNTKGEMKLIDTTYKYNTAFDATGNRSYSTSKYCNYASKSAGNNELYGCNAWAKADSFTNNNKTGNVSNDSTILTYLNTTYYNTLSTSIKNKILTHDFANGYSGSGNNQSTALTNNWSRTWNGKVGLLTASDVLNANLTDMKIQSSQITINNYITHLTDRTSIYWTMTPTNANTYDVYAYGLGKQLGGRRASRYTQNNYTYYAAPAIYVDGNVSYTGLGTSSNPFQIE